MSNPNLPEHLTDQQKQRYEEIAAVARRTADRVPHTADKFSEPAHAFDRHHAGMTLPIR